MIRPGWLLAAFAWFTMEVMVTSVAHSIDPKPHPAQARAGGFEVHARFDVGNYDANEPSAMTMTNDSQGAMRWVNEFLTDDYCRNQQYSITAITTSAGAVSERYAYTAYGLPTVLDSSGSVLASSNLNQRFTYTGREWDETLALHHFRATVDESDRGEVPGRDPIGFAGSQWNLAEFLGSQPFVAIDPIGQRCSLTIDFTDGIGKDLKQSLVDIDESFGKIDPNECDTLGPVCCWNGTAMDRCSKWGYPKPSNFPTFNNNQRLYWHPTIGGSALDAIRELQRSLEKIMAANCDKAKKCDCPGLTVNVFCDATWKRAIDAWVAAGLLEPDEVPCDSRWMFDCESRTWGGQY
jgi:hypothetical protein